MKTNKLRLTLITSLIFVIAVTACSPSVQPTIPTQDPQALQQTADALGTQVAATFASGLTATAAANPTATPTVTATATTEPTATQLPTLTPPPTVVVATLAPTRIILPTVTSTPGEFQCAVTKQNPPAGSVLTPGVDFDARWTVRNTGTEDWASGAADYGYVSGEEMHEGNDAYDLNVAVDTGDTVDIIVDMVAPRSDGRYQAQWAVTQDGAVMCYLPVDITVR